MADHERETSLLDKALMTKVWWLKVIVWAIVLIVISLGYIFTKEDFAINSTSMTQGMALPVIKRCKNSERLQHIKEQCSRGKWNIHHAEPKEYAYYRNILTVDHFNLLYCVIPRVASTSFKTMFMMSSDVERPDLTHFKEMINTKNFLKRFNLQYLEDLGRDKSINYRIKNFFKMIVVRHPLERLYAEYVDKVLESDYFYKNYVARQFQVQYTTVTFQQFLRTVIDPSNSDPNWALYSHICHPCAVHYDQILKLETINKDVRPLKEILKSNEENILPQMNSLSENSTPMSELISAYRQVDPQLMEHVLKYFEQDLKLFGYSWDNVTGPICDTFGADGQMCC